MSVYYRPVPGIPPWVRERIETQGIEGALNILKAEATAASGAGDSTNATALNMWASAIQASTGFSAHQASGRISFFVIRKA